MLSDSEWVQIYGYLVQELSGVAHTSLLLDIERAASTRIEENISEDNEAIKRIVRESREDLDPIRLRAPTQREAFTAAIGVLIAQLREVPALVNRLSEKFDVSPSDIQWRPDISEQDRISERYSFSAQEFKLTERESKEIESVLKRLENLLKDEQ